MAESQREVLQRLSHFRRGMDRLFRDVLEEGGGDVAVDVPVDVFQHPEEIIVEAEVPGVAREDIELYVLRDIIIIEGRKRDDPKDGELTWHCLERSFGRFRRIVELTVPGDTSRMEAVYSQGLLTIRMPRIVERRGKKRRVQIR